MIIEFHYTYILIALGFILTGYFPNLLVFTSIVLIHELGHFLVAKINKLKVIKIIIYPYGGMLIMNNPVNTPIIKELLTSLAGLVFQSIYYFVIFILYKEGFIREYIFNLFTIYHKSIFIFNILPIYPLDGAKIFNLILSYIFPYNLTNLVTIFISFITLIFYIIMNYSNLNYTYFLILSIILSNIYRYYRNLKYLFNKFLLERYIYNYKFKKIKNIKEIHNMYKERYHIIKIKDNYYTEKQLLNQKFKKKY